MKVKAKRDRLLRAAVMVLLQEAWDKNLCDVFEAGWNTDAHLTLTITVGELRGLALLTGARLQVELPYE